MLRRLGIASLAALSLGCMSVGHDFPIRRVSEIKPGKTTQEQVRQIFGDPRSTGLERGEPTWTYRYHRYELIGASRTRDLVVRFDDDGVVRNYSYNSTFPEDTP